MASALSKLDGDLAGTYYPLEGMDEETRQKLVDDHFLFKKGDRCALFCLKLKGLRKISHLILRTNLI